MPEAPEVQYRLATALRTVGDAEGARAAIEAYRELQRRFEEGDREAKELGIALNEARDLANANRLDEALAKVEEILARGGDRPAVLSLRAKVLSSLRRIDEALADIRRAAAMQPGNPELAYLEGVFLLQLDRPAEAEVALRRALALDAGLGEVLELLGGIAAVAGRWDEAVAHLEQAKEAGQSSETLERLLAEARRRSGATDDGDAEPGGA